MQQWKTGFYIVLVKEHEYILNDTASHVINLCECSLF